MGRNYFAREAVCVVPGGHVRTSGRNSGPNDGDLDEFLLNKKRMSRTDSCASASSLSTMSTAISTNSTPPSCPSSPCASRLSPPPRARGSNEIRTCFLHKLGFSREEPPRARGVRVGKDTQVSQHHTFEEDLKGDHGRKLRRNKSLNNKSQQFVRQRRSRSVSFDDSVRVHPIPKRTDYSDRIRDQLWTDAAVQQQNVARN